MAAIAGFHAGSIGEQGVVDVLRTSRLLIPLLTRLGEEGVNAKGTKVDKSAELSIVTVAGPDGRTVLPVFSSVQTMKAWNPIARPVPASGPRVALAAANEGTDLVVVDATSETEFAVRRPALWAMAQEIEWTPSYASQEVAAEFGRSVVDEGSVLSLGLEAGDPGARLAGPELSVHLTLTGQLDEDALSALLGRLSDRWSRSSLIAGCVDSLGIILHSADDAD